MSEEKTDCLKQNDKVNPVADGSAATPEAVNRNSGSTDCSFSAINEHTFVGWIQSHDPDFKWDWEKPDDVIKHFTLCVSGGCVAGLNVNLQPVFDLFFSQGLSGMDMTYGGPETIWLKYFKDQQ